MKVFLFIDRLHAHPLSRFFYWCVKLLLGIGFIISGIRKMPGVKFTTISIENPIGLFFEGMYQTGFYWNFIGYYQIVVGFLLMTPWLKRLTPVLLLPVSVNIFLVSLSLHMRGTPIITACMLLGNLFLLAWNLKHYTPIFKLKG